MSGDIGRYANMAVRAARAAARALRERSLKAVTANLVRDARVAGDRVAHAVIGERLRRSGIPVLSEEDEASHDLIDGDCWVVDPLDGSVNYSNGVPLYCVSIGLWQAGRPVLGVVYDFTHRELFSGVIDHGAWMNGQRITVRESRVLREAVLCTGLPTGRSFSRPMLASFGASLGMFKKVRMLGSAALSLCYVASGRADVYGEDGIAIWDVAAGLALVEAAGGACRYGRIAEGHRYNVVAGSGRSVVRRADAALHPRRQTSRRRQARM